MTDSEQEEPIELAVIPEFADDLTIDAIRARFINAARSIMLEHKLVRSDYCWDITALELYLYRSGIWPDESTHGFRFGTREQLERGTWYLHRDGGLPPKRLGIDITAGSHNPEIHVGFLIAAIGGKDGSGRAVKAICAATRTTVIGNIRMGRRSFYHMTFTKEAFVLANQILDWSAARQRRMDRFGLGLEKILDLKYRNDTGLHVFASQHGKPAA